MVRMSVYTFCACGIMDYSSEQTNARSTIPKKKQSKSIPHTYLLGHLPAFQVLTLRSSGFLQYQQDYLAYCSEGARSSPRPLDRADERNRANSKAVCWVHTLVVLGAIAVAVGRSQRSEYPAPRFVESWDAANR